MTQHSEPVMKAQLAFRQAAQDFEDLPSIPHERLLCRRMRDLAEAFAFERQEMVNASMARCGWHVPGVDNQP